MQRRLAQCVTLSEASLDGYAIQIVCKSCQTTRIVESGPLNALFRARRWANDFVSVSNRMRCKKCGQKWCSVNAVAGKADSPAIGPATDQAYQALVRRMRD